MQLSVYLLVTLLIRASEIACAVTRSLPDQLDAYQGVVSESRKTWVSYVRDRVIENIWPVRAPSSINRYDRSQSSRSNPPAKLLARYGSDVVLRFKIQSSQEAEALASAVEVLFLDVWESSADWVDIRLSKDVVPSLLGLLPSSLQTAHTPLMHDLAQAIYESYPSLALNDPSKAISQPSPPFNPTLCTSTDETNIFFRQYQPLTVISPWMRLLRSLFPTHVRLISIGLSYEGREIQALRVGVHPTNNDEPHEPRKTVVVNGGSHAREWISTSTVNYVAYSFITAYGRSKAITALLEKFDFVFIPTMNPDGYMFTWESDRLWRKNRQQTPLRFCNGLDIDRSFDYQWGSDRSKSGPCSESYSGENAFEAVEARRLAEWAKNETSFNNVDFVGFLDFHSYSQQVLYPYSFSCTSIPPALENLEELAIGLAKAIRTTSGEAYDVTSACEGSTHISCANGETFLTKSAKTIRARMETGGGSALDWFHHELNVPFAYQIKLRDTGTYGFLLPSENIIPTGKEAFRAVEYLGNFLAGNKGVEASDRMQGIHTETKLTHPKDQKGFEASEWVVVQNDRLESAIRANEEFGELKKRRR